jgi:hypothetical protein
MPVEPPPSQWDFPDVADLAALDADTGAILELQRGPEPGRGLAVVESLGRIEILGMTEGDPTEDEILRALRDEKTHRDRCGEGGFPDRLTFERTVEHLALLPIEIPFAGGVEGGAEVLHPEALVGLELDEGIARPSLDLHGA